MTAKLFREAATAVAAIYVSVMFVAAATSTSGAFIGLIA